MKNILISAQEDLVDRAEKLPLIPEYIKTQPEFRLFPADIGYLNSVYQSLRPEPAVLRQPLLQAGLLGNWPNIKKDDIIEKVLTHCRTIFEPINKLTIEDVLVYLQTQAGKEAGGILYKLAKAASPLCYPQFDKVGSQYIPSILRFILLSNPRSNLFANYLQKQLPEWEIVQTSDPCQIFTCSVQNPFPLDALFALANFGGREYKQLSSEERNKLHFEMPPLT